MMRICSFFSCREYIRTSLLIVGLLCGFFWPHVFRGVNILMSSRMEDDPMYHVAEKENRAFRWVDDTPSHENYPFTLLARREIRKMVAPLWNPYNAMGAPLLPNFQTAPFFPLKVLLYLTDMRKTYTYYLISRLFLAGLLMYLFARRVGLSQWGATYAAIAYTFCGYNVTLLQYHIEPVLLMPGLFYVVHRLAFKPCAREVLLTGLAFGIVCISGHPGLVFVVVLGSAIYFLVLSIRAHKRFVSIVGNVGLLVIAGLIASGISMVVVLPFLEFLHFGFTYKLVQHTLTESWKSFQGSGVRALSNLLIPHYVSPWVGFSAAGYGHTSHQGIYYCGVLTLPLALYAVLRKQAEVPLGLVLAFGTIMTFNLPSSMFLNDLPFLKHIYPFYKMPLVAFPLSVFAGRGLDVLRSPRQDSTFLLERICWSVCTVSVLVVAYFGHAPNTEAVQRNDIIQLGETVILLCLFYIIYRFCARYNDDRFLPFFCVGAFTFNL